jgi:hypothetical protein
MLKVFFPGGDSLVAPNMLSDHEKNNTIAWGDKNETSIKLLSRVFSMVSFEQAGVKLRAKQLNLLQNLSIFDFDIAQFCTLMERFKFTWRTAF